MGMFDELKCEYSLPGLARKDILFQTKNLGCSLCQFKIDSDGYLWRRENYDPAKYFEKYGQELKWFRFGKTGEVSFYATIDKEWIEYEGLFINGKMITVKKLEWADKAALTQNERENILINALMDISYLDLDRDLIIEKAKKALGEIGEIPLNE